MNKVIQDQLEKQVGLPCTNQLTLHPLTHLSKISWETFVFAMQAQAICYNAVIFFILIPYDII